MSRKLPHSSTVLAFMQIWTEQGITEPERDLLVKMVCGNEMTPDELKEIEDIKLRVKTRNN